jgi:phosphate transport system substrate-binding protein
LLNAKIEISSRSLVTFRSSKQFATMHRLGVLRAGFCFAFAALLLCGPSAQVFGQSTITLKGSNTFGEELGPILIQAYQKEYPQVTIALESKGSASGLSALLDRQCDIASSSRPINEDESRLAQSRGMKFNDYVIGFYGVAVVTNKANPIRRVTDRQVRDIFTGAITNWKAVGGDDAPISVYAREPASGTCLGFQELAMEKKPYAAGVQKLESYAGILRAVKEDENGIGYSNVISPAETGVTVLGINGIKLAAKPVHDGEYPYSRTLHLYTETYRESAAAKHFVNFVLSPAGQKILVQLGFVPRRASD